MAAAASEPILSPPDSFYGCIDCNFFLHTICAAELPKEIQHASHPQHKLIRCDRMSKPNAFFICGYCENLSSGMFYRCDSCEIYIDLVCAAMPSEIKHDAHKHKLLYHIYSKEYRCAECSWNNQIDVDCARKPGRIKHRWDEHQLCLMYPPVKGHPHDFNCERCSEDINPNRWFYHCHKCDTSFHDECLDQVGYKNIKFGAIVKDDDLHQHSLKISPPVSKFKCGSCGIYNDDYRWTYFTQSIHTSSIRTSPIRSLRTLKIRTQPIRTRPIGTQRTRPIGTQRTRPIRTRPIRTRPIRKGPILTCVSCKFSVCYDCTKL
ncbi:hypothetical protein POM88_024603 [Heracleum sosnowskyi]|uniref:DC1 domain-containing protein n=1 Tax=Heracleum sosnowskyi TaxID=360622 RepID=A0AAD8I2C3_9APIA|nr:hypothetical protein POM88_024603 [Heracleum sosnowskyi]